ncbi:tetratricopeptide repeat protein [Mucilaginibacter glaciei]|uniref:Tetratricopeptide repeat protein n=1 Tax=Mucilaginibacter glaciei TaxID=2772109 RepID=A0A926NSE6_9SPHI|nr:tetratricopeptide repeat protein [Mucilaginibacter glaciei]MBD1393860.1 tetratricopeptide repeat protein [Mucilaginibacter glaciei]
MIWIVLLAGAHAFAQNSTGVNDLIKQGQAFSDQQKYTDAIAKYKEALIAEPENDRANYELAYALYSTNKGAEGIPYLEKAVANGKSASFKAGAYSLLGSVYSAANQFPKSIAAYRDGIKLDSTNQRLYYNLGITQYRARQYTDAETSFISAVIIDSAYAASIRMYALTAFHQNKRAEALLGFCRFLMIDPTGPQSAEAFGNLQNILNGGALKPEPGYKSSAAVKALASYQNLLLTKALAGFATRRYASPTDLLATQLKAVFGALGSMPRDKYFAWYGFADYFYKLSQTDNFSTFIKVISQKSTPANGKWLKDNADKVASYEAWVKINKLTL